ncbi:MAG: 4-hydroxy-tetrahydrodipicolinate synthase [Propionibacteriaceae bacterium]|nr:4-hydroxy-tetrahydrodipicolinate synthase [Propionibacteriaceae bacterium]
MATSPPTPFGRLLTAMVTPFTADGAVDIDEARRLAVHLVDDQRNDGIVVNGTTGEAPTTTDDEKRALVRVVAEAVGDRAVVVAGIGTNDTAHTQRLAEQAADAGAHGLLVVTPYYSRPPQAGIVAHFGAVADTTDLPVMIYDIPHRAGVPVDEESLAALAAHPRITAVKDAKGNIASSARLIADTDLAYYAGDDAMVLPLLAVGGSGLVGTSTHLTGALTADLIAAWNRGDQGEALSIYRRLLPVYRGVFATQGVLLVKAGLAARGFAPGSVRLPLVDATADQVATFIGLLDAAGL